MNGRISKGWLAQILSAILITLIMGCGNKNKTNTTETSDTFEATRANIQAWLSEAVNNELIISSAYLKEKIVDDWTNQEGKYQIVSVRKPEDYGGGGHIANAINMYWVDIAKDESLNRLDSQKTLILYCYYGHGSMISSTILSLLGYRCYSLDFGMMDWSLDALVKDPWDQNADYEVEATVKTSQQSFPLPTILSEHVDPKSIVKEMANKYLAGEGSPIIRSSRVKAIIDNWEEEKAEYQIVDVRSKKEYEAGHVPDAINIPWAEIAKTESLRKLDPHRTVITCSDNGQTGQLATTVLSLLGYDSVNMLFGMMDWNRTYIDGHKQWDGVASYPVVN